MTLWITSSKLRIGWFCTPIQLLQVGNWSEQISCIILFILIASKKQNIVFFSFSFLRWKASSSMNCGDKVGLISSKSIYWIVIIPSIESAWRSEFIKYVFQCFSSISKLQQTVQGLYILKKVSRNLCLGAESLKFLYDFFDSRWCHKKCPIGLYV